MLVPLIDFYPLSLQIEDRESLFHLVQRRRTIYAAALPVFYPHFSAGNYRAVTLSPAGSNFEDRHPVKNCQP